MRFVGRKINIENIRNKQVPTDIALTSLKEVCAKLCVIRDIPLNELEYCVKGFKLAKKTEKVTVDKCVSMIKDVARFFDVKDCDMLFDSEAWISEEKAWVDTLMMKTQEGEIMWDYSKREFISYDVKSILESKRSKTILRKESIQHKYFSQSSTCPIFKISSYELHKLVVELDEEKNQRSHFHIYCECQ